MPLMPGDVKILSIVDKQVRNARGDFIDGVIITISVRGVSEKTIVLPKQGYTLKAAEVEIERVARDEVALLEKYQ